MTAPTINGAKYPQPVDELLPAALKLADDLAEVPSRNRLMREFRIGAPKADALRVELVQRAEDADRAEVVEPEPDRVDIPLGPGPAPVVEPDLTPAPVETAVEPSPEVESTGHPGTATTPESGRRPAVWPVVLLALPAFVAVWSGWVGLGRMTGFGLVDLLPGIVNPGSWATIDSAITLPVGVETYAAYALYVWLSGRVPDRARRMARWSAIASLTVGALGQVAYHLLAAAGVTSAPWWITTAVACLPVAVLGMGAALAHLVREDVTR
jgi:uncharacterized membrane protein YhdT